MDNHKLHPLVAQLAAAFVDDAGGLNIPAPARDVAAAAIAQLRGVEKETVAIDLIALATKVVRLGVPDGGALGVLFVLAAELMGKEQACAVALYQLEAALGSEHGYGNWSYWPEWTAEVGAPSGQPAESASGLWSRNYSTGYVAVNPWPDRGTLQAVVPSAPAGKTWRDLLGNIHRSGAQLQLKPTTGITLVLS